MGGLLSKTPLLDILVPNTLGGATVHANWG